MLEGFRLENQEIMTRISCIILLIPSSQFLPDKMIKLLLDVDTGVDDAQAIMVALADPNVKVMGISCSHGNTPLQNVLQNTLRVLKVCNRLDVGSFAVVSI